MTATTFYPEFVPNQILTNTQLNQLRDHLDQEDRLTRKRLTGTGIICGFNWKVVTSTAPVIQIGKGYGVTSDGDVIALCDPMVYTHHRGYTDPDREEGELRYPPWRDPADSGNETQRDIIELIDETTMAGDDAPEDAKQFTVAELTGGITKDRVLVLYLEHQPVDLNSCLVTSCDNKGLNINVQVRALLVKESDLLTSPSCAPPPNLERMPRPYTIHQPEEISTATLLDDTFAQIVAARALPLLNNIKTLFAAQAALLDLDPLDIPPGLENTLKGSAPAQYRYDALVDFATAHNEAALASYAMVRECCPASNYPRHLMLGALDGTTGYRNYFEPSAIRNVALGEMDFVRTHFVRLRALIEGLDFTKHPNSALSQPSHTAEHSLGRRAVPFYFSAVALDVWRPRSRCAVDADWPWRNPFVPVAFDTDFAEVTWLRIEGHVGQTHASAATQIRAARDANNVEFQLLRTYFADRQEEEKDQRKTIANLLAVQLRRDDARRSIEGALRGDGVQIEPIRVLAKQRFEQVKSIATASSQWRALRDERALHCDVAALIEDYLEARSEFFCVAARVLGMLERLRVIVDVVEKESLLLEGLEAMARGATRMLVDRFVALVVATPEHWDSPEEIRQRLDLPKLDDLQRLRMALGVALEVLQAQVRFLIGNYLPKSLAAFDYEVFAAAYREVARGSLEFWAWTRALGTILTTTAETPPKEGDAPLHPAEADSISADLLALARSCIPARLATAYVAYEALRSRDLSLYRNLAQLDGLEHLAGVAKGGSFILVCDTSAAIGKVLADFSLAGQLPCCCDVDPDKICVPPLALPDVRVITLIPKKAGGGYEPLVLSIHVGANDYDPNATDKPRAVGIAVPPTSEQGAKLVADSATMAVQYRLDEAVPGVVDRFTYRLDIADDCHGQAFGEVAIVFAVNPALTGSIVGTVYSDPAGGAARGATVQLQGTNFSAVADEKGEFVFPSLLPGNYTARASLGARTSDPKTVQVVAGPTPAMVTLVLKTSVPLNGTVDVVVVNAAGAPIRNALVRLIGPSGPTPNLTDQFGKVVFMNAPIGSNLTLTAQAQGYINGAAGPFPLAGGETHVETMVLTAAGVATPTLTVNDVVRRLGINVAEATLRVQTAFADRYSRVVVKFNAATDDPRILVSDPYARAANFLATGVGDPGKPDEQIAAEYKEASTALIAAVRQSTGEAKTAYQEMLSAVSMAYLDRIAGSNPRALTAGAATEVNAITTALKNAEISPAVVGAQWAGEALSNTLGVETPPAITAMLQ